jgi:ATP-dependent helicase/nuclease subunit A
LTTPLQQAFRFGRRDTPQRRNIVIEAGAGTGKTTAIVGEVLELLLSNADLAPERIVLMTFTEKAAGEIADRIHEALTEVEAQFENGAEHVVWPAESSHPIFRVPDGQRERYREACLRQLGRVDGLRSQTIHSFCQSLLRMFPIEAGLDPQFRIIEGFERSLLYGQVYDKWADHETRVANDPQILAEWEALLAHAGYLFRIRDLVFSVAARRDLLDDETYTVGGIDEIEKLISEAVVELQRAKGDRFGDESAERLIAYVKRVDLPQPSIEAWIEYFAPVATEIRNIDLTSTKAPASVKNALKVLRATGKKGDSIHDSLVSHRAAIALIALTRRFIAFTDDEKHALGVADFDDLLLRTSALLDDPQIAERVRQQFDYVFVDEFQDTDRTQARIIERLASDRAGSFVDGRTLIVGDPKQSIYGFRRADPETYQRFSDRLISSGAEARRLKDQYRSDPQLVENFNAMFARVFENETSDANVFRPSYRDLTSARTAPATRDLRPATTFLYASQTTSRDRQLDEAEKISEWILARDGDLNRYAILLRRLSKLDHYLDTFDRYGIEYVLPPTRAFLDRRAPVDLLAVLRAIAHPFDRGAEISAARTPYFALTDQEIAEGIIAGNEAWKSFTGALDQYREQASHLSVSGTIDLLVEASAIEGVYDLSADHRRSLRHLEHLRAIAFTYDQKSAGSLRQFVAEIDRRRNEPDEMEPNLADDDSKAVRILSVHAAKGLEFDTVILPDLSFSSRGNDSMQLFAVEEPRSLVVTGSAQTLSAQFRFTNGGAPLKDVGKERDEAELRRLFYVAVTRAKNEVVFVCSATQKREGFFATLCATFEFEKNTLEAMWPADAGRTTVSLRAGERTVSASFEKIDTNETKARSRKRLIDRELEEKLATGEIEPLNISVPSPRARGEGAAKQRVRGRTSGIVLHRFLELWDGVSDPEPLLRNVANETGADARAIETVRSRLSTLRRSSNFERIIGGETIARELSVRFIDENGNAVERRIDRVLRENEREVVVDYKSGSPDAERLERDRDQVARYCRAVQQITARPCAGLLWYIDADSDQVIEVEQVESSSNAAV